MACNIITECEYYYNCRNSIFSKGISLSKCNLCKLAPHNNDSNFNTDYYSAINTKIKHPILVNINLQKKIIKHKNKQLDRLNKDKSKVKLLKKAVKSEENSYKALVKPTRNSGRVNRDGDLTTDFITIDSKMQSNRVNPEVDLYQLDKVQTDAHNGGKRFGVLLIRNKHDRGVIVMNEEDFKLLLERL